MTQATARAEAHAATLARIVAAARKLLVGGGEVTLRAVARQLGMTAPALYWYAPSYEALVRIIASAIDADVAARTEAAADRQPADDPAARFVAAAVEFRAWALGNRREFGLVFSNVDADSLDEIARPTSARLVFSGLLFQLWAERRFPIPSLADLDRDLVEVLRDLRVPPYLSGVGEDSHGLRWVLECEWSRLYGTVTLEAYGHVEPRIVEKGHLFRAMVEDQARRLGLTDELPRLRLLLD